MVLAFAKQRPCWKIHCQPHFLTKGTPAANGAFYFLLRLQTDWEPMALVESLIRDYRVAVIPGTTFGLDQGCYLRVAYGALEKKTAAEGIGRLVRGLKALLKS